MAQLICQWGAGILATCVLFGLAVFVTLALYLCSTDHMMECGQHYEHYECCMTYGGGDG